MLKIDADLTPRNVLLNLVNIDDWTEDDIRRELGSPIREDVFTFSGDRPGMSAPKYLLQPTSFSSVNAEFLAEEILLIDFGVAFLESSPPTKGVGTPVQYRSPELMLEGRASKWSDVWALGCTVFEMRSGFPLFESFVGSSTEVLQEIIRALGSPPERWWPLLEQRDVSLSCNEASDPSALLERIETIGMNDELAMPSNDETFPSESSALDELLIETPGTKISDGEANCLAGFLQRVLSYVPEQRSPAEMCVKHRWIRNDF